MRKIIEYDSEDYLCDSLNVKHFILDKNNFNVLVIEKGSKNKFLDVMIIIKGSKPDSWSIELKGYKDFLGYQLRKWFWVDKTIGVITPKSNTYNFDYFVIIKKLSCIEK